MILSVPSLVQEQVSLSQQCHMFFFSGKMLDSNKFSQHALLNTPKSGWGLGREGIWGNAAGLDQTPTIHMLHTLFYLLFVLLPSHLNKTYLKTNKTIIRHKNTNFYFFFSCLNFTFNIIVLLYKGLYCVKPLRVSV